MLKSTQDIIAFLAELLEISSSVSGAINSVFAPCLARVPTCSFPSWPVCSEPQTSETLFLLPTLFGGLSAVPSCNKMSSVECKRFQSCFNVQIYFPYCVILVIHVLNVFHPYIICPLWILSEPGASLYFNFISFCH